MNKDSARQFLLKFSIPASNFENLKLICITQFQIDSHIELVDYDQIGMGLKLIVNGLNVYTGTITYHNDIDKEVKKACDKLHSLIEGMIILKDKCTKA